jgi:hypothetical protein
MVEGKSVGEFVQSDFGYTFVMDAVGNQGPIFTGFQAKIGNDCCSSPQLCLTEHIS